MTNEAQAEAVVNGLKQALRCPACGGRLKASVTVDAVIDDDGNVTSEAQGQFRVYCENDCEMWTKSSADYSSDDAGDWRPTPDEIRSYVEQEIEAQRE